MNESLRMATAMVVTVLLLMTLRIPAMAYGVFLVFLVSFETPYMTFQRGLIALTAQFSGACAGFCYVSITGNSSLARVMGITLFTFIATYYRMTAQRTLIQPLDFSVIAIGTLGNFDLQWGIPMNDRHMVSFSLWPLAAGAVSVGCKVAVEYIFTRRNPYHDLYREVMARLEVLEKTFLLYASGASEEEGRAQIAQIRQLAFMGQGKMHVLVEEIEERHKIDTPYKIEPTSIPILARMLDLAAAYAVHNSPGDLTDLDREKLGQMAQVVAALRESRWKDARQHLVDAFPQQPGELFGLAHTLQILTDFYAADRPSLAHSRANEEPVEPQRKRWFVKDWATNPAYALYAFKMSLCAMICFVIYDGLNWPGLSTSVITVLVAGLSTSGAQNQKMLFRMVGSTIGGVIFGLGCIVFIYPYIDTPTPFLMTIGVVTFIAAWVRRCPHFSYIGLQIAFSYVLVVLTSFSAPTTMRPATDRLMGVLLGILVMSVFIRPEKSVEKMRQIFAQLLKVQAEYLKATAHHLPVSVRRLNAMEFKMRMDGIVSAARGCTEFITYEVSQDKDAHVQAANSIEEAMWSSGDLVLSVASWPPHSVIASENEQMAQTRAVFEKGLRSLSGSVLPPSEREDEPQGGEQPEERIPEGVPPYIKNSVGIYQELCRQCTTLPESAS
jgi:multidrug resistance protein MdtO